MDINFQKLMNDLNADKLEIWMWDKFPEDTLEIHGIRMEACRRLETDINEIVIPMVIKDTEQRAMAISLN